MAVARRHQQRQRMSHFPILLLVVIPLLAACGGAAEQTDDVAGRQQDLLTPRSDSGIDVQRQPQAPVAAEEADQTEIDIAVSEIFVPERSEIVPADIYGSWAAEQSECQLSSGQRITVSATSFEDTAGTCEINELVDGGDGFTASLSCERSGGNEAELLKLTPDDDTLALDWVGRDEPETILVRCE